jgi:hypothetical protein
MAITWTDGTRLWVGTKDKKANIGVMLDKDKAAALVDVFVSVLNLLKRENGKGKVKV